MHLSARFWSCLSYVANILTFSAIDPDGSQQPLAGHGTRVRPTTNLELSIAAGFPIFRPPGWRPEEDGSAFTCEYPDMKGWLPCSDADRRCWLRHENGTELNIETNYEDIMPSGKTREYWYNITDGVVNADGYPFSNAKLVNQQYPGPYLQACWGDRIVVHVNNNLKFNGTAIHWHGIRQLRSMHMDGVPGITQCPIAPGDSFTYEFEARQYGSAWYHSHYSVQYADGLLGPLTIYGPHSAHWNEAKYPLLISDWFHNSAYGVIHGTIPGYPTVLLNGTGDIRNYQYSVPDVSGRTAGTPLAVKASDVPPPYRLHFEPLPPSWWPRSPKRYLLRIINTSFETGFVFSIDHHTLEVISADFVPVTPFKRTHLHVGIGQRYNVIVTAKPEDYPDGTMANARKLYWIRTTASPCFKLQREMGSIKDYDRTGILSYYDPGGYEPKSDRPDTKRWPQIDGDERCRDENRELFNPILPWHVGPPANKEKSPRHKDSLDEREDPEPSPNFGERFDVVGKFMLRGTKDYPKYMPDFPTATFSFERNTGYKNTFEPMQINYSEPLFLNLGRKTPWPIPWGVVNETQGITGESWIWLAMAGRHAVADNKDGGNRGYTAGAHPIHLHGHDFAVLQQEENLALNASNINIDFNTLINPLRRDVVLLPAEGFVIIAFKADNPGSWIMHCHIAFHASEGLALQIMERQDAAFKIWNNTDSDLASVEARRVCKNWHDWQRNCTLHFPGYDPNFQCYPGCNNNPNATLAKLGCKNLLYDDSGI